jgi:hypothetical protein
MHQDEPGLPTRAVPTGRYTRTNWCPGLRTHLQNLSLNYGATFHCILIFKDVSYLLLIMPLLLLSKTYRIAQTSPPSGVHCLSSEFIRAGTIYKKRFPLVTIQNIRGPEISHRGYLCNNW